jgi:hypothetical protein
VLQTYVANGDRCSAWNDDDKIPWNRAQDILKELDK